MIETSRKILVVKVNPCTECGIKGLYDNCEDKCVQYKKWYQYQQGRNDAIEEVIAMFKADFDKQNRVNSLYVPTVVVNENIYIDLEQLKENYEK